VKEFNTSPHISEIQGVVYRLSQIKIGVIAVIHEKPEILKNVFKIKIKDVI